MERPNSEERKRYWEDIIHRVDGYSLTAKAAYLGPLVHAMSNSGAIGKNVLSLGEGPAGLTNYLPLNNGHKIVAVDIAYDQAQGAKDVLAVQADIEEILKDREKLEKLLQKIGVFLEQPESKLKAIDTALLTEILNYVDYMNTLVEVDRYMKMGGRVVIYNRIDIALEENLLHPRRPKSYEEIIKVLEELGYEIETHQYCLTLADPVPTGRKLGLFIDEKTCEIPDLPGENPLYKESFRDKALAVYNSENRHLLERLKRATCTEGGEDCILIIAKKTKRPKSPRPIFQAV